MGLVSHLFLRNGKGFECSSAPPPRDVDDGAPCQSGILPVPLRPLGSLGLPLKASSAFWALCILKVRHCYNYHSSHVLLLLPSSLVSIHLSPRVSQTQRRARVFPLSIHLSPRVSQTQRRARVCPLIVQVVPQHPEDFWTASACQRLVSAASHLLHHERTYGQQALVNVSCQLASPCWTRG